MADTPALEAGAARRKSSSLFLGTINMFGRKLTSKEHTRRRRSYELTSKCWETATGGQIVDKAQAHLYENRYIEEIRKLSTRSLKLIIRAHEEGLLKRREDTLTAIKNEIFERTFK